jgi:hypothetical protein
MWRRRLATRPLALAVALAVCAGVATPAGGAIGSVPPAVFGRHQAYDVGSWPESTAIGDFTGDGRNDVALSTSHHGEDDNNHRVFLFVQQADGSLTRQGRYDTHGGYTDQMGLEAGDLNGDGRADLALATAQGVDVVLGTAGGLTAAQLVTTAPARQVEIADLNGDGRADLVVNGTNELMVLAGRGDGTFDPPVVVGFQWPEIEVGDVTGDGRLDLVGGGSNSVAVMGQQPDGTFAAPAQYDASPPTAGNGIAIGDLNGDGRNDVALSLGGNRPEARINVFPQTAQGTLGAPVVYPSYDSPEPLEVGDINLDGRADLVAVHGGGFTLGWVGH